MYINSIHVCTFITCSHIRGMFPIESCSLQSVKKYLKNIYTLDLNMQSSLFALLPLNQFLKLFIYEIPCIPNHWKLKSSKSKLVNDSSNLSNCLRSNLLTIYRILFLTIRKFYNVLLIPITVKVPIATLCSFATVIFLI